MLSAWGEEVVVTVTRDGKPERVACVTWDRYGGGFRTIHGAGDDGRAEFEQRPGRITVFAFHDSWGVVRKQVQVAAGAVCRVALDFKDARPVSKTLWIVDDKTGRAVPNAAFHLIRSGEGMERTRPYVSKADATDQVLGGCTIPESVGAMYDALPNLFLRSAHEADANGRIIVEGLLHGTMDGYVEAEGFAPQWVSGIEERRTVRLTRGGSLAVQVDASPLPLFCRLHLEGSDRVAAISAAELDKQGRFTARNLPPGRYRVSIASWYPGPKGSTPSRERVWIRMRPEAIEVVEGKQARCAVVLGRAHPVTAEWRGENLQRVTLRRPGFALDWSPDGPSRSIRFPAVPEGEYEMEVRSTARVECRVPVTVGPESSVPRLARQSIESIELDLRTALGIVGVWRLGATEPIATPALYSRRHFWFETPRGRYVMRGWLGARGFTRPVAVGEGERVKLTVLSKSLQTLPVSVRMLDPDGEPCEGALEVVGFPLRDTELATRHEFELPAGRYAFVARARGCKPFRAAQVPVDVKRAPVEITIRFEPLRQR